MYNEYKKLADDFIRKQGFGVIFYEIRKYMSEKCPDCQEADFTTLRNYCNKEYAQTQGWNVLMFALLQQGDRSVYLADKGPGSYARNFIHLKIRAETSILAENRASAYARLFFEIDSTFNKISENVQKGCGYNVLKLLYDSNKPLGLAQIKNSLNDKNSDADYNKFIVSKLKFCNLIYQKGELFYLNEKCCKAFAILKETQEKIEEFKSTYGCKWFHP